MSLTPPAPGLPVAQRWPVAWPVKKSSIFTVLPSAEIDARPSDAIAIGLRFDSPIFTYENILAEAGIVLTDEAEEEKAEPKAEAKVRTKKEGGRKDDFKNYSVEKLNDLLKDAIDKEDYERAAKIRDELSKRN